MDPKVIPFLGVSRSTELALIAAKPSVPAIVTSSGTPPELAQFFGGIVDGLKSMGATAGADVSGGAKALAKAGQALGVALGSAGQKFASSVSKDVSQNAAAWGKDPVGQFKKMIRDFTFESIA